MSSVQLDYPVYFDAIGVHNPRITPDRLEPVFEMARGKKVLNIGCCGSDALTSANPVHKRISNLSSYCVGIDIYKAGVEHFIKSGLNAIYADAEAFELPTNDFELAVLGDIIEHVANPGLVLENAFSHLKPGGRIIVTTPNPFCIGYFASNLLRGGYNVNSEHVMWFDPGLLAALLKRTGFEVEEVIWTDYDPRFIKRIFQLLRKSFMGTFGIIAIKPHR